MGATRFENEIEDAVEIDLSQVPKPGQLVSKSREHKGIEAADFCRLTRLTPNVLHAIENDDYNRLGEPVYARGYYRKCAEVLGMNGDLLVDAYEKRSGTASPVPTILQRPSITYRERPQWLAKLAVVLVIGTLVGVAIWWWSAQDFPPLLGASSQDNAQISARQDEALPLEESTEPTDALVSDSVEDFVPAERLEAAEQVAQASVTDSTAEVLAKPVNAITPSAVTPVASPSPQAQPAATAEVKTTVVAAAESNILNVVMRGGDSWTEVSDSAGRKLIYKLLRQGDALEVSGEPPYEIYLGRGDVVSISMGGKPVDFASSIQPTLKARFSLNRQGRIEG